MERRHGGLGVIARHVLRRLRPAPFAALVLAVAACGGDGDGDGGREASPAQAPGRAQTATGPADASQVPLEFTGGFIQIVKGTADAPEELGTDLTGRNGETAQLVFEPPPAAPEPARGTVACGGSMIGGAMVIEASGGDGTLEVDGVGVVELDLRKSTVVFPAEPGPPLCDQRTGTWTGTDGQYEGRRGRFTFFSVQPETAPDASTLKLEER